MICHSKFSMFANTAALLIIGLAINLLANPVTISNHSFESPDVSGNTLGGCPTGWTGITYTIDDEHTNINPDPAPDGTQYAMFRNAVTGYQVLTTKIVPQVAYTLT